MRNGLTKANGIHVVIEDRDKSPSILSSGISVQPGAETNIGLKKTTISRLEAPFASDCMSSYLYDNFKARSNNLIVQILCIYTRYLAILFIPIDFLNRLSCLI